MSTTTTAERTATHTLLKFLSLGLLVPHTIIYTLLAAVARKPDAAGHVFFGPSAVALMECGKMMISVLGVLHHTATDKSALAAAAAAAGATGSDGRGDYVAIAERNLSTADVSIPMEDSVKENGSLGGPGEHLRQRSTSNVVAERPGKHGSATKMQLIVQGARQEILNPNGLRLLAPALLYVCQNNLQVFSAGCLTPAEYQIVGQTKLAFTAIFSVLILKRQLNWKHWSSIATLALGTIIVQTISVHEVRKDVAAAAAAAAVSASTPESSSAAPTSGTQVRSQFDLLIGTAAMLGASACSGLGGVLVEALLKKKMHFWTTNVHLAFFSLVPACVPILVDSFVHGSFAPLRFFTFTVWALIGFNILGGIIASMTMKYADNILKNFAVAISLIGTVYLSALVSAIPVTLAQFAGTALVVAAIAGYARA